MPGTLNKQAPVTVKYQWKRKQQKTKTKAKGRNAFTVICFISILAFQLYVEFYPSNVPHIKYITSGSNSIKQAFFQDI